MITAETIEQEVKNIPPLKQTIIQVMLELNQAEVDFDILEKKISRDPALAVRILAVANSPFYGFTGKIDNIKESCLVLGIHTAKNIVLAAGVINKFSADSANNLDITGCWHHSLATAAIAKVIASKTGIDPDTSFAAGLLHEIGKMVLDVYYPDDYRKVIEYSKEHDCLLYKAELAVLGFSHYDIGGRIIRHWKLPEDIAQAIEQISTDEIEKHTPMSDIIHVSNIMARALDIGETGDTLIPPLNENALKNLGLDIPTLTDSFHDYEQVSHAAGVFLTV